MINRVRVLGVPFSLLSMDETASLINSWMDEYKDADSIPHTVITANPEIVMQANGNAREAAELRDVLESADLITPDGIGIVLALRMQGYAVRDRVTGADLTPRLLAHCSRQGYRVFVLGASEENNRKAIDQMRRAFPGASFAGHHGYFSEDQVADVLDEIRTFSPHLLLVGLGMPRQEHFIARYRDYLCAPVSMGVGGVIDIFAGTVKRAPRFWIAIRCEWLYRLLSQPTRWRRQLVLPVFAWRILTNTRMNRSSTAGK